MRMPEPKDRLSWMHKAKDVKDLAQRYDAWAEEYDRDLAEYGGMRFSAIMAEMAQRYAKPGEGPILDAGAGTGALGEQLSPLGYTDMVGIDISEGMLKVARRNGRYKELRRMALGEPLDFSDDTFAHFVVTAVIREEHIPPRAFDELIRVTRPGGYGMFSIVDSGALRSPFIEKQEALEREGKWELVEASDQFQVGDLQKGGGARLSFVYRIR